MVGIYDIVWHKDAYKFVVLFSTPSPIRKQWHGVTVKRALGG